MYRFRNNICKPYKYTRKKLKANKKSAEASKEQNIGTLVLSFNII